MTPEETTAAIRREALRLMSTLPEFTPGDTRRVVSVCDVEEMVRQGMELPQIRNDALEEAAIQLETQSGEGFNDGAAFHQCARAIRRLKTCPNCGQKMFLQWVDNKWQEHSCNPKA